MGLDVLPARVFVHHMYHIRGPLELYLYSVVNRHVVQELLETQVLSKSLCF